MRITEQTFYRWKKEYGGMGIAELRRLKKLRGGEPETEAAGGGPEPG
jgi:hypothetical protein